MGRTSLCGPKKYFLVAEAMFPVRYTSDSDDEEDDDEKLEDDDEVEDDSVKLALESSPKINEEDELAIVLYPYQGMSRYPEFGSLVGWRCGFFCRAAGAGGLSAHEKARGL